MRTSSIIALWLSTALPVWAAGPGDPPSRWYLTGSLGSSAISDPDATYAPSVGAPGRGTLRLGGGFMTGGTVGWYARPGWRIEADYNYRTNRLRSTSAAGLDAVQADADIASVLIMANVLKDFDGWDLGGVRLQPYVGAGLGLAQEVDTDLDVGGAPREFSGSRSAWQLLAGVQWHYRSPWFAGVGLRYVDAGSVRMKGSPAGVGAITADYRGLGVDLRLGYRF